METKTPRAAQTSRTIHTRHTILWADGKTSRETVFVAEGAAFTGQPTAYAFRNSVRVWLVPGESVQWMELS